MIHQPPTTALEDSTDTSQNWQPLPLPFGLAPADLHAQVCQRLSSLDVVEKAISKERSELGMAWNRTLPVNRLPNELLVSIFAQVAEAISTSKPGICVGRCYPNAKWTKVILVCRYWRDLAYTSPKLWRVIHMQSPLYTPHALALSTPATIGVSFGRCKYNPTNLKLLQPHTHRLRSLRFTVIEKAWRSAAVALLQRDGGMPSLETLKLPFSLGKPREPRDDDFVDVQLTQERFPCLRSLTVTLTVAPQDIQICARLWKLSLSRCRCNFSFDHFLDALAASVNLQSLQLDSILQRIQGDWVTNIATGRDPLSLVHLKSLNLIGDPPVYISRFLSHILLSPTVSVGIKADLGNVLERNVTETIAATLPSNPAIVLPALSSAKEVFIYVGETEYSLSCFANPGAGPHPIVLQIDPSSIRQFNGFSIHGARDLLSLFASAPLTMLDFAGDCGNVPAETMEGDIQQIAPTGHSEAR